jgi:hypothetical protein
MNIKHLLNGAAFAAVLAIAAPTWAQPTGAPPPAMAAPPPAANSAVPPAHHAVRHAKAMHSFHRRMAHKAALTGDTTAQLNREELARIQSGGPPMPPPASMPAPMPAPMPPPTTPGGNAVGTPGPNPGGPGLTPYSGGAAPPP